MRLINLKEAERDLEAKEKKTAADKLELKRLKKEIAPLELFIEDAASHRKAIKAEIGMTFSHSINVLAIPNSNFC